MKTEHICKHGLNRDWCMKCQRFENRVWGFLLILIIVLTFITASSCRGSVVSERFLDALSFVESSNRDNVIGKRGEIGRFQITKRAKSDVDRISPGLTVTSPLETEGRRVSEGALSAPAFHSLTNPIIGRAYARAYCLWLESRITRALRRPATAGEVYAAYNCGPTRFASRGYRLSRCPLKTQRNAKFLQAKAYGN